jgi:hypothetical protein
MLSQDVDKPKHRSPTPLTHQAPSGMTCSFAVDLLGCYSKRTSWTKRLPIRPDLTDGDRDGAPRRRRSLVTKLSTPGVAALVDSYRAGTTVYELATRFGIHRVTVSAHLHRQGVIMRRQGLNPEQVDQAVHLYAQGQPVARIGTRLGVDGGTVWSALRARGVHMRDPQGRDR